MLSEISRRAITGFLSLSLSIVMGDPEDSCLDLLEATTTRSKRFEIVLMQSSTVIRANVLLLYILSKIDVWFR